MRKAAALCVCFFLLISVLSACGQKNSDCSWGERYASLEELKETVRADKHRMAQLRERWDGKAALLLPDETLLRDWLGVEPDHYFLYDNGALEVEYTNRVSAGWNFFSQMSGEEIYQARQEGAEESPDHPGFLLYPPGDADSGAPQEYTVDWLSQGELVSLSLPAERLEEFFPLADRLFTAVPLE